MPSDGRHQLTACRSRALFQLQRTSQFVSLVTAAIPDDDQDQNRQYLYQSSILMVQSFLEEYLRCVVSLGTFWKAPEVRKHLALGHPDPDHFATMPVVELCRTAQERVSFDKKAGRLKALVQVIAGRSPFADNDAEEKCLDFANVRNFIAHRGGWPDATCASIVKSKNVIVESGSVGTSTFFQLHIKRDFFAEGLSAVGRSIVALEEALARDLSFGV